MEITNRPNIPPPAWLFTFSRIQKEPGKVLVIGDVDTGKTTFCLLLVNALYGKGIKTGVMDLDVGQSHIGPPTMLGLGRVSSRLNDLEEVKPVATYDVGNESPAGFGEVVITGTTFLIDEAGKRDFEALVIDTTGYISTEEAVNLKLKKIEILNPEYLILLERDDELQVLKGKLVESGVNYIRLPVPPEVRGRDLEERARFRHKAWFRHLIYTLRRILTNKRLEKEIK